MKTAVLSILLYGIGSNVASGQSAPTFEVASLKPSPPRTGRERLISMDTDPGMVRYSNITLRLLIARAYQFDSRMIQGIPAWLDYQPYDLAAKIPPGASKDIPAMLQALLVERFKLALHRESKEQRVYFLVIGKNGPKLKEAQKQEIEKPDVQQVRGDHPPVSILRDRIIGHAMPMAQLAAVLMDPAGYQVIDHTGLAGLFDIDLTWTPEDSEAIGPSIFTAVQEQLGLKFETGKAPVEVLSVDHVERIPLEN